MSWTTLSVSDLYSGLTSPEVSALQTAATKTGQADPVAEAIAEAVQTVRGYVAANRANQLGDGATIPLELKSDTLAIARFGALNRLPVKSLMTQARIDAKNDAISKLKDVAAGRFAIEQPATASAQVIAGPGAEVSPPPRVAPPATGSPDSDALHRATTLRRGDPVASRQAAPADRSPHEAPRRDPGGAA